MAKAKNIVAPAAAKKAGPAAKAVPPPQEPGTVLFEWNLAELPSSQHRAGLAGLVLVVRWLERKGDLEGTCRLTRVDARGATLELDREGLGTLLDEIYGASSEEVEWEKPHKDKDKKVVEPLRTVEKTVKDKKGKETKKTYYVYPQVIPRGSFLADSDSASAGGSGLWIKLWRDLVWGTLRGVPATRRPFQDRAEGAVAADIASTWNELTRVGDRSVDLPSTYFVGAQAQTAEAVGFTDRARQRFLLHFWPFATPVYVPQVVDNEGKSAFTGFALVFPDIVDLESYCVEYPAVLSARGHEVAGYLPREAVVDLAVEGALDAARRLGERIARVEGRRATSDLVHGFDIIHVEREGNNVRVRSSTRVEPDLVMVDEYARLRGAYWNRRFRRQRLLNLVEGRPWHAGFDRLAATIPSDQFIGDSYFRRDARTAFTDTEKGKESDGMTPETKLEKSLEEMIYKAVGAYISRRVASKTGMEWESVKDDASRKGRYEEARAKVAKDAFLAVRSRTGADFVEYFTGTLCSVPQHVGEEGYLSLSRSLLANPDAIRTLTLLALSARG